MIDCISDIEYLGCATKGSQITSIEYIIPWAILCCFCT